MEFTDVSFSKQITFKFRGAKVSFYFHDSGRQLGVNNVCSSHTHRYYELKAMVKGCCMQYTERGAYDCKVGDLVLVHPGEKHYLTSNEPKELVIQNVSFSVKATEKSEDGTIGEENALISILDSISYLPSCDASVFNVLNMIADEIPEKKLGCYDYVEALTTMLLIELLRHAPNGERAFRTPSKQEPPPMWWGRIKQFLAERYMDDIDVQDLADHLHMSKRQVSRTFEKEFNSSFTKELMTVRLHEAQRQLAETDKNLQDICIDIGFSNQSYFAACFKKHLGMTPSEYRATQREKRKI